MRVSHFAILPLHEESGNSVAHYNMVEKRLVVTILLYWLRLPLTDWHTLLLPGLAVLLPAVASSE